MNKNIKKWINRLRSGKVKQGRGRLARTSPDNKSYSYCCLGVACQLAIENGVKISRKKSLDGLSYSGMSGRLPSEVIKWLGLSIRLEDKYVDMNDSHRLSFKDIANEIEKDFS